jgi:hypothetical protein
MSHLNTISRKSRVAFALACTLAAPGILSVSAQAQTTKAHSSWFHRHPTATTAGAGVGAYAMAKHSKHGVFHRHPVATGIGAAVIAHHYAKKHSR